MRTTLHHPLIAVLAATMLLAGCGSDSPVRDTGTRALVIAIDGADWKIIDELAAEGGMPNLMKLRQSGVWGPIATLSDIPLSPVIWTSVATGKSAKKHGITWFMVDRPDGTRVPVRSYNRKVKAIWNLLAESDRRAAVVGWWATYPAEDVGDGTMVSDALGFHGFGATARGGGDDDKTHPPALFAELAPRVPAVEEIPFDFARRFLHLGSEEYAAEKFSRRETAETVAPAASPRGGADGTSPRMDPQNPIHLFQQYAATAEGYTAVTEELLAERDDDLTMVYFEQVDSFSHLFMKYAPPKLEWVEEAEFERYRDIVLEWYRYQDELIGRLLAKIDLSETAVFVLSDHGFKSGERRITSTETVDVRRAHLDHERDGIFVASGPHIRRGGAEIPGASVLDLTPTLLYYLGFPLAEDMDGQVLERVFQHDFRDENPIRTVATYEGSSLPAAQVAAADETFDAEDLAATEEALRALGYLGGSSEDGAAGSAPGAGPAAAAATGESSPEIHNNLGRIHLRDGEIEQAQAEFEKALELDPRNAEALLNLGSIHRREGRVARAEHFVERALRVDPNSIGALAQLAEIKRDQDDLPESIRLYQEAMRIDDSQPFLHLGLGDSLQRAGRYDEAEAAFRTVLGLDPDSFEAHYNLGVTHLARQRIDDAVGAFEKALELDGRSPRTALAYNNLGSIHLRRGEREQATERFRQAAEVHPGHLESRFNLGILHLQAGRSAEAIPRLEEAAALAPNHERVNASLGMAYLLAGRNQDAYRSLLLVRRLYPENWVSALGLALLHAGAEQPDKARELLADALRLGGETARAEAGNYPVLKDLLAE